MKSFRIGIFSTFRDRAALDLFKSMYEACKDGFIKGEISFVFCNREKGEFPDTDEYLRYVENCGVPLILACSRKFRPQERREARHNPALMRRWRIDYDRAGPGPVAEKYKPDLIILSGYMLILGAQICEKWKMINLHPALPWGPKGSWEEVVWELMRIGRRETGAMMHLVTKDLDRGPPISFYRVSLGELEPRWSEWERRLETEDFEEIKNAEYRTTELFRAIRETQLPGEVPLVLLTLKYMSKGRIEIRRVGRERKVFVDEEMLEHGMRLDKEIESFLKRRPK